MKVWQGNERRLAGQSKGVGTAVVNQSVCCAHRGGVVAARLPKVRLSSLSVGCHCLAELMLAPCA